MHFVGFPFQDDMEFMIRTFLANLFDFCLVCLAFGPVHPSGCCLLLGKELEWLPFVSFAFPSSL